MKKEHPALKRQGQAAMEFLMTYGWAILVILIAIGALLYFGIPNPERFIPNRCKCSYVNMSSSLIGGTVTENNITYVECFESQKYLNDDKTKIKHQFTYSIFICDDNELIPLKN